MAEWLEIPLGKLTSKIGSGATPRGGKESYKSVGTPLIRSMNIYDLHFNTNGLAHIDDGQAAALDGVEVAEGDVLLNITGASVARCCLAPGRMKGARVNQHVAIIRPRQDELLGSYLAYLLVSPRCKDQLLSVAQAGATREALTKGGLEEFCVAVPPLPTQQRIAAILSTYDELIENNTRRISILEEMARRLYEEWFVHLRFPGHEDVEFDGELPSGWRNGVLKDVVVLQRGFDLPKKTRTPGPHPVIAATGQHGTHQEAKVNGPGVVTGRSGSLGKVNYVEEDFWPLNTTLWGKEFPLASPIFAFFVLSSIDLAGFNSGAAVPTLNRNDVHGLPMALPDWELLERFEQNVQPMFNLKRSLERQNANLRAQRDLLLPKLVSGEIDVSEAEEAMEAAE